MGYAPSGSRSTVESVMMARAVEQAGFDEVWLAEDYSQPSTSSRARSANEKLIASAGLRMSCPVSSLIRRRR
jgi:alkanesulfonate monooxygenase SsuD/methylene tetrahydromethanopterin reductase-like flavin-dependent oxidoreductase (luciferase family)